MDEFVVWGKRYQEGSCVITNPAGFKNQFMLAEGVPLLSQWPGDVVCEMSPKYPKDIRLADNLHGGSYPVISSRLKQALAGVSAGLIEFLPVAILNHKKRVAAKDYFVLNPVGNIDCIDMQKSGVTWNAIDETEISHFERLVLKEKAVPSEVALFRLKHQPGTILVRRSLGERLSSDGYTGLHFLETASYKG